MKSQKIIPLTIGVLVIVVAVLFGVRYFFVPTTVIYGEIVPPEPDSTLNNSTLAGVDVNKNGVRDDVERLLVKEFGSNQAKFLEAMKYARAEQAAIVNPTRENIAISNELVECTSLTSDELNPSTHLLLNTTERSHAYGMAFAGEVITIRDDCK